MAGVPSPDSLGPENRARLEVFPVHTLLHPPAPIKTTSTKCKNIKAKPKELVGLGRVRALVSLKLGAHASTGSSRTCLSSTSFTGRPKVGTYGKGIAAVYNYYFKRHCAELMGAKHVPDGVENKAFPAIPPSGITTSPLCESDRKSGNELTPMQPNF